jgi:hypothetical protein
LAATYLAPHNAQFAIQPETVGTAFVADTMGVGPETLCLHDTRVVGNENTVAWNGRRLQIPASRLRPHVVKATVRVHEYPDGLVGRMAGQSRRRSEITNEIRSLKRKMAETEGFEPSIHVSMYDDLANRCLQPLGHISS